MGTQVTDDRIIKTLENAWHRAPNDRPAEAWLLTSDVAKILQISITTARKRLKRLKGADGKKVRGIQKGRTWLWIWAEGWSNVADVSGGKVNAKN